MDENNNVDNVKINEQLVHNSLVRLKWLKLTHDDKIEYDNYCYKFDKIMDCLDKYGLGLNRKQEDFFFNAGLPEGSRYFRGINKKRNNSEDVDAKIDLKEKNEEPKKRKLDNVEKVDFLEYHKANGHCNLDALKKQAERWNLDLTDEVECENCSSHQLMINCLNELKEPKVQSREILDIIYAYLSPELPCLGYTGSYKVKRFFIILDDYSRMMFIYTLRSEKEIVQILFKFLKHCERSKGGNGVKQLVTERKPEFNDSELVAYLKKANIEHVKTDPDKREPVIDYHVRLIQIMLKLLMADAEGIDKSLWAEAVKCAVYIYNNLPNKCLNWKTPSDKWIDKTLRFSEKLYPFGSWFMAQLHSSSRSNFSSVRMVESRFVGYHPHTQDLYKLYDPKNDAVGFYKIAYRLK